MDELRMRSIIAGVRKRCFNENCRTYKYYGGKGVTICERWYGKGGGANFVQDMGPTYKPGLTLERIDVNGNYEPSNCTWATMTEQANNRTNNRVLSFNGQSMTVAQWAREIGIKHKTLHQRLNGYGWSVDKALSTKLLRKAA
jgi:hypothetical protein